VTSKDKLRAAIAAHIDQPITEDANVITLTLQTLSMMGVHEQLLAELPDDPRELDELLEWGAVKILELRSDDAEPLRLSAGAPE